MNLIDIIVVTGPTASGKTDFAVRLAQKYGGEVINCDSKQIYKFVNIGTNKGNIREINNQFFCDNIPIHLINFKLPSERYSVFEFQEDAFQIVELLLQKGKKPIIVGGTGLYISSIVDPNFMQISEENIDPAKRGELETMSLEDLQILAKLKNQSGFQKLNSSDVQNKRRLIRVIEKSNTNQKAHLNPFNKLSKEIYYPKITIFELEKRIEERIENMLNLGWVEEVINLLKMGFSELDIKNCGIGYASILNFLEKRISKEQMIRGITTQQRQYAKKQIRWFKKYLLKSFDVKYF